MRANAYAGYLVALALGCGNEGGAAHEGRSPVNAGAAGTPASGGQAGAAATSRGGEAGSGAAGSPANLAGNGGSSAPGGRGGTGASGSGAPGTAGHGGSSAGAPAGNGAGGDAAAGTSTSGGAGGMSGTGSSDGGRGGAGVTGAAGSLDLSGPVPDLRFSGLTTAVELAPLRVAANGLYPGKITIASGGVDDLCGTSPKADVATNAETQFLRASATSGCEKVRVIFTVCEGLYRIVAKKSAGITTLADLAGKSVMAPSGASSAYYLTKMLSAAGLAAGNGSGQVNVVNGSANGSTFTGGSAPDAATIWEPGIEQASEALGSDAIEFQHDAAGNEVYRELFNLHTTTDVLADATKRHGVVVLLRALIEASAQIRADPSVAYPVLTGPAGVSQAVLAKSMQYERYAGTLVPDVLDVMAEEEVWRANIDSRAARSRDDLGKLIDDSVLSDALSGN